MKLCNRTDASRTENTKGPQKSPKPLQLGKLCFHRFPVKMPPDTPGSATLVCFQESSIASGFSLAAIKIQLLRAGVTNSTPTTLKEGFVICIHPPHQC